MKIQLFVPYLLLLFTLRPITAHQADPVRYSGLLREDDAYRRIESIADIRNGDNLPVSASLKAFCPAPRDQGALPMDVAFALTTALSIRIAALCQSLKGRPSVRVFSAAYIFNQIREGADCSKGAFLSRGLELLKTQGVCLELTFPTDNRDCSAMPGLDAKKEAMRYRAAAYYRIFDADAPAEQKLLAVKNALAAKSPVLVGMQVDASFQALSAGDAHWAPSGTPPYGHALVVVGYDDKTKTVELVNSYGADWANGGFLTLDYATFASCLRYGIEVSADRLVRCD